MERAWDSGLLETGWEVGSSWPVHTESEHSLQIARTELCSQYGVPVLPAPRTSRRKHPSGRVICRTRSARPLALKARESSSRLASKGVDLYLSTFGPVLGRAISALAHH